MKSKGIEKKEINPASLKVSVIIYVEKSKESVINILELLR